MVRRDFPALEQRVHGRPLAYLDNAATAQKPYPVIEAVARFYRRDNANVHRGVHTLGERATAAYEAARERVRAFINARSAREIVFVRGSTEAINLVAHGLGQSMRPGDEVVLTNHGAPRQHRALAAAARARRDPAASAAGDACWRAGAGSTCGSA
jgi:cysteine desulfurase/selenocysteine lyase